MARFSVKSSERRPPYRAADFAVGVTRQIRVADVVGDQERALLCATVAVSLGWLQAASGSAGAATHVARRMFLRLAGFLRCRLTNAIPTQTFVMVLWIPVKWLPGAHITLKWRGRARPCSAIPQAPIAPCARGITPRHARKQPRRGNKPARGELKCPISALPKFL